MRVKQTLLLILFIALLSHVSSVLSEPKTLNLYLSADRTTTLTSTTSIEQGIRTALAEHNNQLGGFKVELILLDHRGSTPRAKKHLHRYLQDDNAIALFAGLHSPPLLATRELINKEGILTLVPWAAAAPISRYPSSHNWIFRLSIDDSKAGYVISRYAIDAGGVRKPALLLEQTGWGKSNLHTMTDALKKRGLSPALVTWFNWGLSVESARIQIREINQSGADAIFLVANAPEGKVISRAMVSLPKEERLPIYSHWGITGGDFPQVIDHSVRKQLQLAFIQTSFSFLGELTTFQKNVLNNAKRLFPASIKQAHDIKAPTGFIHAYDLTQILIAAAEQADLTGDIFAKRAALRTTLEQLETPVKGLLKTYRQPFSPYSTNDPDAHEALSINDFVMARYGRENEILLYPAVEF